MKQSKLLSRKFNTLLSNSRFWILTVGFIFSILVAGFIQLYIPSGSIQTIRIEQWYGFISMLLLYIAMLASPVTKVFPKFVFKDAYLHARRAIGVLSFYYAFLHVYITFFKQLGGFSGIPYLNIKYSESLLFGVIAFGVLFVMAITSLDWAVKTMHFKNWKLLHRLVYFASVFILVHVIIIGPHYVHFGLLSMITYIAIGFLVLLETIRIQGVIKKHNLKQDSR